MARRKHKSLLWQKWNVSPRISWMILGIVSLFLVLYGFRLACQWNKREWIGTEPYRILVLHQSDPSHLSQIEVVSVWPDTRKAVSVSMPPDVFIGVVGGYGSYRIAALEELGRVENVGSALLSDSVGFLLGMPIHQVVRQQGTKLNVSSARQMILREGLTGKRSLAEAMEIRDMLAQIRGTSVEKYELSEKNTLYHQSNIDGTDSLHFEQALVNRFVTDNLSAMWPAAAAIQVAAINASGKPQMAALWSRYVRVGGFDLVSVTDQQTLLEKTKIVYASKELMESVPGKALRSLLPFAAVEVGETSVYRAHVAILFGHDSWSWLNERASYLPTR